jgi:hypothetical protein
MGILDFFNLLSSDFKKAVPAMAKENGWTVSEVNADRAILEFQTGKGRTQTLYILKYPDTLEFSVPSAAAYNSLDEIPDGLATSMLKRNDELQTGFWALEEIGQQWVFSVMRNEELDRLHVENFGKIVEALVEECDRFER